MAFYGVERGGGGSWWSWSWGGALWPLCHGMCVHSHHLLATNTHAQRHADRHTHTQEVSCYGHQLSPSVTLVFY